MRTFDIVPRHVRSCVCDNMYMIQLLLESRKLGAVLRVARVQLEVERMYQ